MLRPFTVGLAVAGALALFLLPARNVQAQQVAAGETSLAEIVVTARKRQETLIDAPLSVQAFSSADLQASGVKDLKTLQSVAGFFFPPQVGTAAAGRSFGALTFRGLAPDLGLYYENSGSLFIDGVFISGGLASVNTADVERVEVLKGPQNAFFGRSTFGGAINFITRNPSKDFQGHVDASIDNWNSHDLNASVEGPVFGKLFDNRLTGRLMVLSTHKAGQYTATDGGKLGEEDTTSVTGTLYATPTDNLWLRLRAHYQEDDDGPAALGYIPGNASCVGQVFSALSAAGAPVSFRLTKPYICGSIPRLGSPGTFVDANTALPNATGLYSTLQVLHNALGDPFLSEAPTIDHSGLRRDTFRLALQGGYALPHELQLDFNAGYNRSNSVSVWDLDRTSVQNFFNIQPLLTDDLTVDLRLTTSKNASVRGLLGASYFRSQYRDSQIDLDSGLGLTAWTLNTANYLNNHSQVPAVYGSVDWDILQQLTFTADVRYQKDKITDTLRVCCSQLSNETSKVLPRVILSFKPGHDTNIYASWSKGAQPLQLNSSYVNANALQRAYLQTIIPGVSEYSVPPELKSFELGLKQRLFEGRLEYSLVGYDSKWKNRPTTTSLFNPDACTGPPAQQLTPACPLSIAGIAATFPNDATIKGIEFQANGLITRKWSAGMSLEWTHARWDSYYNANFASWTTPVVVGGALPRRFDGNTVSRQPDLMGSLNSTYRDQLTGDWSWYVRGDLRYFGKMWTDDLNIVQTDPYTRVNAHLGFERDKLGIELYVNNLFQDTHWDYDYRLPNLALQPLTSFSTQGLGVAAPEKREIGLKVSLGF